jgi:feruloyl esterase
MQIRKFFTTAAGRRLAALSAAGLVAALGLTGAGTASASSAQPVAAAHAAVATQGTGCSAAGVAAAIDTSTVTVTSVEDETAGSYTPPGSATAITGLPDFCAVEVTETDSAGNPMHIQVWLPATWNGDFEGTGGGGFACTTGDGGISPVSGSLQQAIDQGFAAAATDCGLTASQAQTGSFGLNPNGTLNETLINDFFNVGIHDMTVVGKDVTKAFYQGNLKDSYFLGCSTGGREGLEEAQQYPGDYNGISANSPAINWTQFIPAEIWPYVVMNEMHDVLPACIENAFTDAALAACGGQDGASANVISDPADCDWNPYRLVGLVTPCGTITRTDAAVVAKIWEGPTTADGKRLWYGLDPGASFAGLAATTTSAGGVTTSSPFFISAAWLGTFVEKSPSFNPATLTYSEFDTLFSQSVDNFNDTVSTNDPNLTAFKDDGGKLILTHGTADQLIFPEGTVNYYQRVDRTMGGASNVDTFARLFLAPGEAHCASANGPAAQPFSALADWVQHGKAPSTIPADLVDSATNVTTQSRILCAYPELAYYDGHGSINQAQNFVCEPGPAQQG